MVDVEMLLSRESMNEVEGNRLNNVAGRYLAYTWTEYHSFEMIQTCNTFLYFSTYFFLQTIVSRTIFYPRAEE